MGVVPTRTLGLTGQSREVRGPVLLTKTVPRHWVHPISPEGTLKTTSIPSNIDIPTPCGT